MKDKITELLKTLGFETKEVISNEGLPVKVFAKHPNGFAVKLTCESRADDPEFRTGKFITELFLYSERGYLAKWFGAGSSPFKQPGVKWSNTATVYNFSSFGELLKAVAERVFSNKGVLDTERAYESLE